MSGEILLASSHIGLSLMLVLVISHSTTHAKGDLELAHSTLFILYLTHACCYIDAIALPRNSICFYRNPEHVESETAKIRNRTTIRGKWARRERWSDAPRFSNGLP